MRTLVVGASPPAMLREWGNGRPVVFLHAMGPVSSGAMVGACVGPLVQAAVPQADIRLVPGTTHSLVTDLREEFGAIVADWLVASPSFPLARQPD